MPKQTIPTIKIFPEFHNVWILAKELPDDVLFEGDSTRMSFSGDHRAVVFHTLSDQYEVSVGVLLSASEPSFSLEDWNHVVETRLKVAKSGIEISNGMPDSKVHQIVAQPGNYRVRVYVGGLEGSEVDGESGSDFYQVVIWPQADSKRRETGPKVLKQWGAFLPPPLPDRIWSARIWGLVEHPPKRGRFVATFVDEEGLPAGGGVLHKKNPGFAQMHAALVESEKTRRFVTIAIDPSDETIKRIEFTDETQMVPNVRKIKIP